MRASPAIVITTIERLRLEHGLTLPEIAAATGLDRKTLYSLEHCKFARPKVTTMHRLAKFYGVAPDWLLREYIGDYNTLHKVAA